MELKHTSLNMDGSNSPIISTARGTLLAVKCIGPASFFLVFFSFLDTESFLRLSFTSDIRWQGGSTRSSSVRASTCESSSSVLTFPPLGVFDEEGRRVELLGDGILRVKSSPELISSLDQWLGDGFGLTLPLGFDF